MHCGDVGKLAHSTELTPYEFEEFVAEYLKSNDFTDVSLTPKSGDYGADIIATSPAGERTAVQCKLYSSHIGVKAVQEVNAAKDYYRCQKSMVVGSNSYTSSAEKMAAKLNVELVTIRQNSI